MEIYTKPLFPLYLHLSLEIFSRSNSLIELNCPNRYYAEHMLWQLYLQTIRMSKNVKRVFIVRPGRNQRAWEYFDQPILDTSGYARFEKDFVEKYSHVIGEVIERENQDLSHRILW